MCAGPSSSSEPVWIYWPLLGVGRHRLGARAAPEYSRSLFALAARADREATRVILSAAHITLF